MVSRATGRLGDNTLEAQDRQVQFLDVSGISAYETEGAG
jgi:hypothetical protein